MAASSLMALINAHVPRTTQQSVRGGRIITFPEGWQKFNRSKVSNDPPQWNFHGPCERDAEVVAALDEPFPSPKS